MFCLPDNIERSVQRNNSSAAIRQLRALSALGVEADKFDREKWRVQLGPILELWQQMVSSSPGVLAKRAEAGGGAGRRGGAQTADSNPVDDFVSMESTMSGALCNLVDASLAALKKVLFGSGLLSPHIQTMATALLSGSVPPEWTKQWDGGPEKPQAWIRELVRKRMALSKWSSACAKGNLLDAPVVLGDLFNPATFINALRQQTARKLGCAIDRMKMVCAWEKDAQRVASICPLACSLSALLLQGADFQGGELQETAPEGSEIVQAPSVTIGFVSKDEQDPYSKERSIGVPTYFSNTREEFLMELAMPCGPDEQDRWVLAGVALFLTEDD